MRWVRWGIASSNGEGDRGYRGNWGTLQRGRDLQYALSGDEGRPYFSGCDRLNVLFLFFLCFSFINPMYMLSIVTSLKYH